MGNWGPVTDPAPDDDDLLRNGPSLSADGHLEGRFGAEEPPPAAGPPPPAEAPLELAPRAPRPVEEPVERSWEPLRPGNPRPGALKAVVALLALAVVGSVALLRLQPKLHREPPDGVRSSTLLDELLRSDAPPLIITSEPPGAAITIDGKTIGQTPWAGQNRWTGRARVALHLNGYAVWEGSLNGGTEQRIAAELTR
jgi:hypothetical protein